MVTTRLIVSILTLAQGFLLTSANPLPRDEAAVNTTTCAGKSFAYHGLAGYGALPSDLRDKFGDTLSTGSAISITGWKAVNKGKSYKATIWALPDRGWNTEGTTAYQPRVHKFSLTFTPTSEYPSGQNLVYTYEDTILFTDAAGTPFAGLDPTTTLSLPGFPALPAASFPGDGFGGEGPGGIRASLDPEGLALDTASKEGGFWISDEYGPYLYHFALNGTMDVAIAPPNALLPLRKGVVNFSSDNPPIFDREQQPDPIDPTSGRANNQGFEGLTYSRKDNALYTLLQSASVNNGGLEKTTNRYTTLLKYALNRTGKNPTLAGEWTVPLPQYNDPSKKTNPRVAASSAIHALGNDRFLILSRDGNAGRGQDSTQSLYRHVDIFSLASATNFVGQYDDFNSSFAPEGVLRSEIVAAEYCPFVDMNLSGELAKFGLINGGTDNDAEGLLNEKWEGLATVPVYGEENAHFLFASSDNDFITQNGYYNFGRDQYKDASGFSLLSQTLVFKISVKGRD